MNFDGCLIGLALDTLVYGVAMSHRSSFQQSCAALAGSLQLAPAEVLLSQFVEAGTTLEFPNSDPTCGRPAQSVSGNICRVALTVPTSNRSGFSMEAWLPENWSGRFLSTGNGGLGGCIQYEDIDYGTSLGFATVGTNNGHDGMTGQAFLNNLDIITDYAWRAMHEGVVLGKQISAAFYQAPHKKSYYLGCSTGGRQGFKEAQAFPDDFDGIVAGAPAFAFNNLTSWSSHFLPLTGPVGATTFVPFSMWPMIHDDVLQQCDALDGLRDSILESPDLCNYTPDGLICAPDQVNATNCLTPTQAQTVRSIYSPLLDATGAFVFPREQPGSEIIGAPQTLYNGQPFGASDWFKYAIFNNPDWDPATLTPADYILSSHLNLADIETWDGDLSAFKNKGGKLLHYHGLEDPVITSENSPRYYEHVSQTMGQTHDELDEFYRFFRISGMSHCEGGPGATYIGNVERNVASYLPHENVLMMMVKWVEEGFAPQTITGTAYVNGNQSLGVAFKRRHCRWPRHNFYEGGDPNDEASWNCKLI
jgi:feruloyl esterase